MNTDFKDQPAWFTGVVEDINDPSEMGRLKVRCFGYHTPEKDIDLGGIPTSHLPWAHVMMPINGASMSGIGQSATGVLQGSWVIGFFRDGEALQDPFVIGSLPSMSTALPAITNGFNDPDGGFPLTDLLGESDMSRAARTEYAAAQPYVSKEDTRQELIGIYSICAEVKSLAPWTGVSIPFEKTNLSDRVVLSSSDSVFSGSYV